MIGYEERSFPFTPGTTKELLPGIFALHVAIQQGLPGYSFAIKTDEHEMVLIDALQSTVMPAVEQLIATGLRPKALVILHRHVVGTSDINPREITEKYNIPVFMHPLDAQHPQSAKGSPYDDPIGSDLLTSAGLEAIHFPGHTEGHILLKFDRHGGVLFTGDCAMGAPLGAERRYYIRPPIFFSVNDPLLRENWLNFKTSFRSFIPYHGLASIESPTLAEEIESLTRQEVTEGFRS